jgi:hypothetical protein
MQEEIDELLTACVNSECFILDTSVAPTTVFPMPALREILDLLSGNITVDVAGGFLDSLRAIRISTRLHRPTPSTTTQEDPSTWAPKDRIPTDLPDHKLFAVLLHLMHPGTLVSARSAALVAVYALASGNQVLAPRAEHWLASAHMRGSWTGAHDRDAFPEVVSVQFMHIVRRVWHLLTAAEMEFFDRLWYVWRLSGTELVCVSIQTCMPIAGKPEIRPDHRITCCQCQKSRPLSLTMTGTCVFCADSIDAEVPECAAGGKSHMVQCRVRTCLAFYAVERPLKLLCEPRCHYCRNRLPAPLITCKKCKARHVTPGAHNMEAHAANDWICAMCDTISEAAAKAVEHGVFLPRDSIIVQEAPGGELLLENPGLRALFKYAVPPETRGLKLSEAMQRFEQQIASQKPQEVVHGLTWHGAAVHHCEHVCDQIREAVCRVEISKLCPLCCSIRQLAAIAPVPACDCKENVSKVSHNKHVDPPADDFSSRIKDFLSNTCSSAETARHLTSKVLDQGSLEHGLWELWEAFFSAVSLGHSQHESLISLLEAIRAVPTTKPSNTSSFAGPFCSDTL